MSTNLFNKISMLLTIAMLCMIGALAACENDGPVENAAEEASDAVNLEDNKADKVEEAAEEIDEAGEDVKEKMER